MDRRRLNSGGPRRDDGRASRSPRDDGRAPRSPRDDGRASRSPRDDGRASRSPRDGGQIRRDRMDQLKGNEIKIERRTYKTGFDPFRKAAEVFNKDRIQRIKGFAKDFNDNLDQMINIYHYIDGIKYIPDQYKRKVFEKVSYNVKKISQEFQTNNENIKKSYKNDENKETRNTYEKGIEDSLNSLKGICQELQGIRSDLSHRIQTEEKNISSSATISKEVGSENDDKCFISDNERSFGVFDGVAGHGGGHVAAEIAQKYIQQELDKLPNSMSGQDVERTMKEIIKKTHEEIKKQQQRSEYREMSTTATVVKILKDGTAVIGNIGDSRAYLYNENEGSLKQLTIDNAGFVQNNFGGDFLPRRQKSQELLAKIRSYRDIDNLSKEYLKECGFANTEQAKSAFDGRASINECLGSKQGLDFKIYHVPLNPGDKLLLTTDGVHDNLTDDEMKAIMQMKMNSGETSKGLASAAKLRSREYDPKIRGKRAKPDDITVLVIDAEKFVKTKDRPSTSRDRRGAGPNRWK